MAIDYSELLADATTAIAEAGRAVTFSRESTTEADPAKPWGAAPTDTDTQSVDTIAVIIDFEKTDEGAGAFLNGTKRQARAIVQAAPGLPEEVGPEWTLTVGSLEYEILDSGPLNPGGTLLIYDMVIAI